MTDDSQRDQSRGQRPAPPYVRRPGDMWREELPSITRYLYDAAGEPRQPVLQSIEWKSAYEAQPVPVDTPSAERPPLEQTGSWILEEWEQYDWKKAATLGADPDVAAAQEAWGDLDWEGDDEAAGRQRPPEIVADILENIARRIRDGDLRVNGSAGMTEEAALTTVLAALLGVRR